MYLCVFSAGAYLFLPNMVYFSITSSLNCISVYFQLVPTFFYPIWSAIWAVFHLLNFILMPYYRIDLAPYKEAWPFYLSNWTYTVLTVGAVSDCIATFYVFCKKQSLLVPIPGNMLNYKYLQIIKIMFY